MKKLVGFFAFLALMTSSTLAMGAERKYKNSLDWGTGLNMGTVGMYEYPGENVFAKGIDFSMRYTRFIDDSWGLFLEGDISYNSASRSRYFSKLDKLDGGKYTYDRFTLCPSTQGRFVSSAFIGGVYRYDIGNWSFRPRAGFGVAGYLYQRNKYYRTIGTGEGSVTQAVMILPSDDESSGILYDIPACKLGLQTNYFLTKHFYLALDLDLNIFLSHHVFRQKIYNTEKRGNSLFDALAMEDYKRTDLVSRTRINTYTPPMGAVRFTIGFDF
jgi:hypothetical protein